MSRHTYVCPIRWGDLDAQGHVNNAEIVDYLQEARVDFLLSGPLAHLLDAGVIVVGHQVEYVAPIGFAAGTVRIELWVDSVGAARFAISYELFVGETLVGRARTVVTPYDLAASAIRRLSVDDRAVMTVRVLPPVQLRPLTATSGEGGFVHPVRVRWSDLDSYGHVNNVKCFDYLQEARVAWFAESWASATMMILLARQDVDYVRPIDFRLEPYLVRLTVAAVGTTSVTLAGVITDETGTTYARGRTVGVCADPTGQPISIPDALRRRLTAG